MSFWDEVGGAIVEALRTLMLSLCDIIYKLIVFFFDIFMMLGNASILTKDTIMVIYERIGLILGLFMIFRVTFSLIQYVINPDLLSDNKQGFSNIIKKVVMVVVLLGITPSAFKFAYQAQRMIIESNVIPKVITGKNIDSIDSGGNLAWYVFNSFYSYNETAFEQLANGTTIESAKALCPEYADGDNFLIKNDFLKNHSLEYAFNCVNIKLDVIVPESGGTSKAFLIDFTGEGIVAVVVGLLVLWMVIMYVIQVGVRVVQLAYLQLIAPIPILMYLDPKNDETLNKWFKQCISTYLDFFIRVAIIYFVVFIIDLLISNDYNGFIDSLGDTSGVELTFIIIVMIIALLIFAKKVPDLIKDLFPNIGGGSGKFSFGLKPPKEAMSVVGFGAGAVAGGAVGLLGGGFKGLIGGLTKGAISGAKGKKISEITSARAAQNVKNRQMRENGSTFGGRMDARFRNTIGLESRTAEIDRQIHDIDINDIRPIDDRISAINRDPIMEQKRKNDAVIAAKKAINDRAESEMLKKDAGLQAAKLRLDYLESNLGKRDSVTGNTITSNDIINQRSVYKSYLESKTKSWVDANSATDSEIVKQMRIISNETGTVINDYADAEHASDIAKSNNTINASRIADLEFEKQNLERTKQNYEQRKSRLNRDKEKPQADENAIKK